MSDEATTTVEGNGKVEDAEWTEIIPDAKPKDVRIVDIASESSEAKPKRKRRTKAEMEAARLSGDVPPRAGGNRKSSSKAGIDPAPIANTIQGFHEFLGELVSPDCKLTDKQALIEAEAIVAVAEQYDMQAVGKYAPWIALVGTILLCETTTAVAITKKVKEKRQNGAPTITGTLLEES
jgi:hypothetical protein